MITPAVAERICFESHRDECECGANLERAREINCGFWRLHQASVVARDQDRRSERAS